MAILIIFVSHWYLSLFFQSFYHHRYSAHRMFSMSKFWEKVFYIGSFITQGSSYLSPYVYGAMHRMHHAYADTEKDPHSPKYDATMMSMMLRTRKIYLDIEHGVAQLGQAFTKNLPEWKAFDKFASSRITRLVWILVYIVLYVLFANSWWLYLLIPLHIVMGPLHGVIINWFAHKYGYTNHAAEDTSKNLFPVDLIMLGEGLHNNHHKFGGRPNFGYRWFEFDPIYPIILLFDKLRIIRLAKANV
ncbi:MAG: acyl-CoA desaturase [Chitinophagales bacterium]|nr:acyl-CoA desaturase [Chitinophagales bacterium]